MEITKTKLGIYIIKPQIFEDNRGFFMESWNKHKYEYEGINFTFVQDNISTSKFGVIRGMHFQTDFFSQGKLIQVLDGEIYDVAVDVNPLSPNYGKWEGIKLDNTKQIFIPPGFAHGFLTLSLEASILYKCTQFYNKESEKTLLWNDPDVGINWNFKYPLLSEKDKRGINFKDL
jgi:dTDP-4-dehydrorhamnose 3,5-epimerase